jgi:hypothetical protein
MRLIKKIRLFKKSYHHWVYDVREGEGGRGLTMEEAASLRLITIEGSHDILAQREVTEQIKCEKRSGGVDKNKEKSSVRCYGICEKTDHNKAIYKAIYKEAVDISSASDTE